MSRVSIRKSKLKMRYYHELDSEIERTAERLQLLHELRFQKQMRELEVEAEKIARAVRYGRK